MILLILGIIAISSGVYLYIKALQEEENDKAFYECMDEFNKACDSFREKFNKRG